MINNRGIIIRPKKPIANLPYGSLHCVLSHSVMSDSLRSHGLWPARLLCPMELSRQEYWSGLPCPPPGGLSNLATDSTKIHLQSLYEENSTCYNVSEMAQHKNIICNESHASVY